LKDIEVNILFYLYSKSLKKIRGSALSNSFVHNSSKVHAGSALVNSNIDRHSFCGYDCSIINCNIGSFCSIASKVSIGGLGHPMHFVSTSPVFLSHQDSVKTKFARHDYLPMIRTEIGADVWIGEGVLIKSGLHIGHGAVIGMGAVVTRDVPPYAVVGGNPAQLIRYRFNEDVIKKLLDSRWWTWSDDRLHKFGPYMNDPDKFLQQVRSP
jgi:acetyltransferase-like isoleucine patch superfamily enzyme